MSPHLRDRGRAIPSRVSSLANRSVVQSRLEADAMAGPFASDAPSERHLVNSAPVFVMNPYYSAIGIARSLHAHRIKVYALAAEADAPGARSRYFEGTLAVPNGRDEPDQLCVELVRIGRTHAVAPVLFPTRDFDVLFLHDYRARLSPFYRLPEAEDSPILRILDKFELASVARSLGIATPATFLCSSAEELERHISILQFPVVVKPRFAYQWRRRLIWTKVGSQKAFIAQSPDELRAHYQRVGALVSETLIQEYVPGGDREIVVWGGYFGRDGQLSGYFTARKLRQDPPSVGTGCVVEAIEVPGIVVPSTKLLRAFGYRGLAEVEFKRDRRTGTFQLIEVNPRHWDQHELGRLVGVNVSWIAYQDIVGGPETRATPVYEPRTRYKWIAERELVGALLRAVRHEVAVLGGSRAPLREWLGTLAASWRELAALLAGRRIFAVFSWRDPIPGMLMSVRSIRQGLGRLGASVRPRYQDEVYSEGNHVPRSSHRD